MYQDKLGKPKSNQETFSVQERQPITPDIFTSMQWFFNVSRSDPVFKLKEINLLDSPQTEEDGKFFLLAGSPKVSLNLCRQTPICRYQYGCNCMLHGEDMRIRWANQAVIKLKSSSLHYRKQMMQLDRDAGGIELGEKSYFSRKVACWHKLLGALEEKYKLDYIIIDLNPAGSKMNFLAMLRYACARVLALT